MILFTEHGAQHFIDYMWDDEQKSFEEAFETEVPELNNIKDCNKWIKWCEDEADKGTEHIFYRLLQLKASLFVSKRF